MLLPLTRTVPVQENIEVMSHPLAKSHTVWDCKILPLYIVIYIENIVASFNGKEEYTDNVWLRIAVKMVSEVCKVLNVVPLHTCRLVVIIFER